MPLQALTSASFQDKISAFTAEVREEAAPGRSSDKRRNMLVDCKVPQQHSQGTVIDVHCAPQQWELQQVFMLRDQSSKQLHQETL